MSEQELTGFKKLPAIEGSDTMPMDALLGVGFGDVTVTRDNEYVWSETNAVHKAERLKRDPMLWQGKDAEEAAAKDPNHDWRVHFVAPLYEALYQRQGKEHWVLVERGEGFA